MVTEGPSCETGISPLSKDCSEGRGFFSLPWALQQLSANARYRVPALFIPEAQHWGDHVKDSENEQLPWPRGVCWFGNPEALRVNNKSLKQSHPKPESALTSKQPLLLVTQLPGARSAPSVL